MGDREKEAAKERARKLLEKNPNYYRDIQRKSTAAWKSNGRKPRGASLATPEQLREWQKKSVEARKKS